MEEQSDKLRLATTTQHACADAPTWFVLVVDDEPDIHSVTTLVLDGLNLLGRRLTLLHAYSLEEAIDHLNANADIALILLDIVMAKDTDGLDIATYARNHYDNPHTRIIVRTGQPGALHESKAAESYGINYYEPKTQMTAERLRAVVHMALDSYQAYCALEDSNQNLRQVLADVELFSHAIAHDIRGPARNLHMLSQLLQSELPDDTKESTMELVDALESGTASLLTMLEQLLSLSQLGKESLSPSRFQMADLASNAIESFRERVSDPGIVITICGDCTVTADFDVIRLVINNLLDNAHKYRNPSRPLTINIDIRSVGTFCEMDIIDNGIGIPEDKVDEVFLPFRRVCSDSITSGSGIGLALCKRIVDLHDGTIKAFSDSGHGTRICLRLPRD